MGDGDSHSYSKTVNGAREAIVGRRMAETKHPEPGFSEYRSLLLERIVRQGA